MVVFPYTQVFDKIGWILYGLYNSLQRDAKAAKHEQRGTYIDAVRLLLSVHWKENLTHVQLGHDWTGRVVILCELDGSLFHYKAPKFNI